MDFCWIFILYNEHVYGKGKHWYIYINIYYLYNIQHIHTYHWFTFVSEESTTSIHNACTSSHEHDLTSSYSIYTPLRPVKEMNQDCMRIRLLIRKKHKLCWTYEFSWHVEGPRICSEEIEMNEASPWVLGRVIWFWS